MHLRVARKRPRTVEEQKERFLAHKAKLLAVQPIDLDDETVMNGVDNPPSAEQYALIPPAVRDGYSRFLSLKILEPGTKRFVKCLGRYRHPTESWFGGVNPEGDDSVGGIMVTAIAWADME